MPLLRYAHVYNYALSVFTLLGQSGCSRPPSVRNGQVSSSTFTTATYRCNTGYQLIGSSTADCNRIEHNHFVWVSVPICRGIINTIIILTLSAVVTVMNCNSPPSIPNGSHRTPTRTTVGGTVTYTCNTGYQRSGSATVTCQASGSWSTRPICHGTAYLTLH